MSPRTFMHPSEASTRQAKIAYLRSVGRHDAADRMAGIGVLAAPSQPQAPAPPRPRRKRGHPRARLAPDRLTPAMRAAADIKARRASERAGACAVYIMESLGRYKVGISRDPGRRARGIGLGAGVDVRVLVTSWQETRKAARRIEARMHRELAPWRTRGEWFAAPRDALEMAAAVLA